MLHIKNDYYIKAATKSYILMKKMSRKDKVESIDPEDEVESVDGYKNIGYYSKIETAIKAAMEEMIRDEIRDDDVELKDIVDHIAKLRVEMDELLHKGIQRL